MGGALECTCIDFSNDPCIYFFSPSLFLKMYAQVGEALEALHSPVSPVKILKSQSVVISYSSEQTKENFDSTRDGTGARGAALACEPGRTSQKPVYSHFIW